MLFPSRPDFLCYHIHVLDVSSRKVCECEISFGFDDRRKEDEICCSHDVSVILLMTIIYDLIIIRKVWMGKTFNQLEKRMSRS